MIVKRLAAFVSAELFLKLIPLLLLPVYINLMGIDGYGEVAFFSVGISFLIPLIGICFNQVLIRTIHQKYNVELAFISAIFISIFNCAILLILICLFEQFLSPLNNITMAVSCVFVSLFAFIFLLMKELALHGDNKILYSSMLLVQVVIVHVTTLASWNLGLSNDAWLSRLYGEITSYLMCILFFGMYLHKKEILNKFSFEVKSVAIFISDSFTSSISLVPRTLFRWYRTLIERNYLLVFISAIALGSYTIASQISIMLTFPIVVLLNYFSPNLVQFVKNDNYDKLLRHAIALAMLIVIITLSWLVFGTYFISFYIGTEFSYLLIPILFLFLSAFFVTISTSLLTLPLQAGISDNKHNFVLFLFVLCPFSLYVYQPDSIFELTLLNISISFFYFLLSLVFFIRDCGGKNVSL
jgi:O-antigen/teichoic acid export membrane protein